MTIFLQVACSRRIVVNALKIALVVGSVLNLINQGDRFFGPGNVSWLHVILNFAVPYCVASYSAARNQLTQQDAS